MKRTKLKTEMVPVRVVCHFYQKQLSYQLSTSYLKISFAVK